MIPELRKKFNKEFKEENYNSFLNDLNSSFKYPVDFRVAETPVFLSDKFTIELFAACEELSNQVWQKEFLLKCNDAVPPHLNVPGENEFPQFFVLDFAICASRHTDEVGMTDKDDLGNYHPKLIEMQGFPTLYGYQYFFEKKIRKYFDIPDNFTTYFNNFSGDDYKNLLKDIILADRNPENVILLEIEPENQKTRVDFAATEELLGIKTVCVSEIIQRGRRLFYKNEGKEIPVERIYNRVIFDELGRSNVKPSFNFKDELDVTWISHPNWFFKISKYSLPLLKSKYVPDSFYLKDLDGYPDNLEDYVLKPLFSFAGLGVKIDVTEEMLDNITDRENYILQEKIEYAPLIETPDEPSKVEIRTMFFIKNNKPILVNNLVRLSKGKMMGVDFNKNKTWVGGSAAFHRY